MAGLVQFVRFGLVGASGYVVNLSVFSLLVHGAGAPYLPAGAAAFSVAALSNYLANRSWTFAEERGRLLPQGTRFLAVSLAALAANLTVLHALVSAGAEPLQAQVLAIVLVTPLSFLGNKLWTFRLAPVGAGRAEREFGGSEASLWVDAMTDMRRHKGVRMRKSIAILVGTLLLAAAGFAGASIATGGSIAGISLTGTGTTGQTTTGPKNERKVTICHKAGPKKFVTIRVNQSAVKSHLKHGDHTGKCTGNEGKKKKDEKKGKGKDDDKTDDKGKKGKK